MGYRITDYTKQKAKEYNVIIKPSKNKLKKLDVFKDDKQIASIGAKGYKDYPTFINENGLAYANQRKKLYKQRHRKEIGRAHV